MLNVEHLKEQFIDNVECDNDTDTVIAISRLEDFLALQESNDSQKAHFVNLLHTHLFNQGFLT